MDEKFDWASVIFCAVLVLVVLGGAYSVYYGVKHPAPPPETLDECVSSHTQLVPTTTAAAGGGGINAGGGISYVQQTICDKSVSHPNPAFAEWKKAHP